MIVLNNKVIHFTFTQQEFEYDFPDIMYNILEQNPSYFYHYITLAPYDLHKHWASIFISNTQLREISLFYEIGQEAIAIAFFNKYNSHLKFRMMENCTEGDPRRMDCMTFFRLQVEDIAALN